MENVVAGYFDHDIVLDDVTIEAKPGVLTAILGPNGSGKSTSLRVLYGFVQPRSGRVLLDGEDITSMEPNERLEQGIALLPQGRSSFPQMSIEENLIMGAWLLRKDRKRQQAAIEAMFDRYPVLAERRSMMAGSLSGGQQRLLEIARTLVLDPQIILVDEPSVGLAPILVDDVYRELARLREDGRTVLLVDQNVHAAVEHADYVYTLEYGRNNVDGGREDFHGQLGDLIRSWLRL